MNEEESEVPEGRHTQMGSSYLSIHIHVVFSTKARLRSIKEEIQPKLWAYMAGIAENHGMHAVKIGGIDDHVHLLINLGGKLGISKAVQLMKTNSSGWMNDHPGPRFEWQEGYFACSVSRSQVARVTQYIANQRAAPGYRLFYPFGLGL